MLKLDHIALGANDLDKASQTLSEQLGVLPFGGGEHDLFGTHNKLWRIETDLYPIYLELIAVNPNAVPKRPRWFGLENVFPSDEIHLLGFIAGTDAIDEAVKAPPFEQLEVIDVARGALSWKFGITNDGGLLADGALPYLIEWQGEKHPLDGVAPQGLKLQEMAGNSLHELALDFPFGEADAKFSVSIQTPSGRVLRWTR